MVQDLQPCIDLLAKFEQDAVLTATPATEIQGISSSRGSSIRSSSGDETPHDVPPLLSVGPELKHACPSEVLMAQLEVAAATQPEYHAHLVRTTVRNTSKIL